MIPPFSTNPILFTLILSLTIQAIFFVFAALFKTDKLTDLSYGLTFIFLAFTTLISNPQPDLVKTTIFLTILIWGIRLSGYLFIRIMAIKKDHRFNGVREDFFKFLGFWTIQALTVWIVLFPATKAISQTKILNIHPVFVLGLLIWLFGFLVETIADYQKFTFKNKIANKDKPITTGLFRYSRHPNYFGEMALWFGLYIFVFGNLSNTEALIGIVGPLYIALLILFVSGVPLLEKRADKKWGDNPEYIKYKQSTSILIPWFKKKR